MLKRLSIYTIANILNKSVGFLLLPLLSYELSKGENGLLANALAIYTYLMSIVLFGVANTMGMAYYRQAEPAEMGRLMCSALVHPLWAGGLLWGVALLAGPWLGDWLACPPAVLWYLPLLALSMVIQHIVIYLYMARKESYRYAVFSIVATVLEMGLSLFFLLVPRWGYESRLYAIGATGVCTTVAGLLALHRMGYLRWQWDIKLSREAFWAGVPLIVHGAAQITMQHADKIMVTTTLGEEANGVYAFSAQIGNVILVVVNGFIVAWQPFFFEQIQLRTDEAKIRIIKLFYVAIAGFFVLSLVLHIGAPWLFDWKILNPELSASAELVYWVSISYTLSGVQSMLTYFLLHAKKNQWIGYIALPGVPLYLIFGHYFMHLFGVPGVVYARILVFLCIIAFTFAVIGRFEKMPWLFFWSPNVSRRHHK